MDIQVETIEGMAGREKRVLRLDLLGETEAYRRRNEIIRATDNFEAPGSNGEPPEQSSWMGDNWLFKWCFGPSKSASRTPDVVTVPDYDQPGKKFTPSNLIEVIVPKYKYVDNNVERTVVVQKFKYPPPGPGVRVVEKKDPVYIEQIVEEPKTKTIWKTCKIPITQKYKVVPANPDSEAHEKSGMVFRLLKETVKIEEKEVLVDNPDEIDGVVVHRVISPRIVTKRRVVQCGEVKIKFEHY